MTSPCTNPVWPLLGFPLVRPSTEIDRNLSLSLSTIYPTLFPIWVLSLLLSSALSFGWTPCCALKMMKKSTRVLIEPSPSPSNWFPVQVREGARFRFNPSPVQGGEEARARFKHQALMQDYEELLRVSWSSFDVFVGFLWFLHLGFTLFYLMGSTQFTDFMGWRLFFLNIVVLGSLCGVL